MSQHMFTPDEQSALRALVAQIIPASQDFNQPGADDPEIFADILKSGAALRPQLARALASLSGGAGMDAAKAEAFRQEYRAEAEMIQALTIQCYYRDPRVLRAIGIDARPPFPKGYRQEPNDLTLLEPVRARGEIYRKAP